MLNISIFLRSLLEPMARTIVWQVAPLALMPLHRLAVTCSSRTVWEVIP